MADVDASTRSHVRFLAFVALLTAALLVLTVSHQIYDSNLYATTEAMSILAGDRPYIDFPEPGTPLAGYLTAGMQVVSGGRLLGEFLKQWLFIVAGVTLAVHVGMRVSRSVAAMLPIVPVMMLVLIYTPTYHYSKLFFFPLALLCAWRYVEAPGVGRSVVLALVTVLAFLYRHDYGAYLGVLSVATCLVARAAVPASRRARAIVREVGAYALTVLVLLAPWAALVQATEGFAPFVRSRLEQNQGVRGWIYLTLRGINPGRTFRPESASAPVRAATVAFEWNEDVGGAQRADLEREFSLRPAPDASDGQKPRYELPNVNDARLMALNPFVHDTEGFDWDYLRRMGEGYPSTPNLALWLQQMALLVSLGLLLDAGLTARRARRAGATIPLDVWRLVLAGSFLIVVNSALLREPGYVVTVAPLSAALGARFLTTRDMVRRAGLLALVATSTAAAFGLSRGLVIFDPPSDLAEATRGAFARLVATPPDYGSAQFSYVRDCTVDGDRVLVTGLTPLHVSYFVRRPIAGGQINWHRGWRSSPEEQAQALALLEQQSVPFAISTADPILTDFEAYPRIREYLVENYTEVPGSNGLLLVDRNRPIVSRYGAEGWPCFR